MSDTGASKSIRQDRVDGTDWGVAHVTQMASYEFSCA